MTSTAIINDIARPEVEAKTIMDPMPGEKFVEYSKDGADGDRKSSVDSGLDVEVCTELYCTVWDGNRMYDYHASWSFMTTLLDSIRQAVHSHTIILLSVFVLQLLHYSI
jgi:hypothetical protein